MGACAASGAALTLTLSQRERGLRTSDHAEHDFAANVARLVEFLGLAGIRERHDLLDRRAELARIDQFGDLGQLFGIRLHEHRCGANAEFRRHLGRRMPRIETKIPPLRSTCQERF